MRIFRSQAGAVALITTILVAVLISIVTISLSDVLTTEQRQSTDLHDSERAYYAANAGLEDALARIRHYSDFGCLYKEDDDGTVSLEALSPDKPCLYPGFPNVTIPPISTNISCTATGGPDEYRRFVENGSNSACWTYRTVSRTIDQFSGKIYADNDTVSVKAGLPYSVQADLSSPVGGGDSTGAKYIQVQWGPYSATPPKRCSLDSGSSDAGALLEVTLVSFKAVNNNPSDLVIQRGIAFPHSIQSLAASDVCPGSPGQSGDLPYKDDKCDLNSFDFTGSTPNLAYCARFTVDSNKFYIVRLRDKFASTPYKITAYSGPNRQVHVNSNLADISVTGRSGDTYRRLVARKQLTADVFSVFDFILFSQDDLTKNISCLSSDPTNCNGS